MGEPNEIAAEQDRMARILGGVALVVGLANFAAAAWMVLASEVISFRMMACFLTLGISATSWGALRLRTGAQRDD